MTWEDFSRKVQPLKVLEAYRLRILSSDMMTLVKIYLVFNFLSLFRLQSVFRSSGCRVTATDMLLIWPWWGGNEDVHWSISRDRYLIFCWNTIAVSCFRPWSGYICIISAIFKFTQTYTWRFRHKKKCQISQLLDPVKQQKI